MGSFTAPTTPRFTGALTALITPFRNGEVDERALRDLVDYQIQGGINGLIPCGTTGESVTMTDFEHDRVIDIVIDQAAGRVPVIAGTGTNNTRASIEHTRHARAVGADAALVVVPYYNKPTQEGMYRHFEAVANSTDLPIILYNIPGRSVVNMTAETTLRLAEIPNVVGIKESAGNMDQVSQIAIGAPADFAIFSGDDSLTLPIMSLGGHGVVSVVSNIVPDVVSRLTGAALAGNFAEARSIHQRLFDLARVMFIENNPTGIKTAAGMLGLCSDELRLPMVPMAEGNRRIVETALRNWGFPSLMATAAD